MKYVIIIYIKSWNRDFGLAGVFALQVGEEGRRLLQGRCGAYVVSASTQEGSIGIAHVLSVTHILRNARDHV